jgi:hypothetical protein
VVRYGLIANNIFEYLYKRSQVQKRLIKQYSNTLSELVNNCTQWQLNSENIIKTTLDIVKSISMPLNSI